MATPYITPQMVINAPTGAPWNIIPFPNATSSQQLAEQTNICWRATAEVDGWCNQPLRATIDTETVQGPDFRLTVDHAGVGRAVMSRWPILDVLGGQVSPRGTFPRQWTPIPANMMEPEQPPIGLYGSTGFGSGASGGAAVLIAPGYVSWANGRNGFTAQIAYLNGWPHAGLSQAVADGGTTLQVDDVTGFAGSVAFIYDGQYTEQVSVLSVAANAGIQVPGGTTEPTGPGTLTLATGCQAHNAGVVVSALPQDIPWAAVMLATAQVIQAGAGAVTIQNLPGSIQGSADPVKELKDGAHALLAPYRRVV